MGHREQEEEWKKGRGEEIDALGLDASCPTELYFWRNRMCSLWWLYKHLFLVILLEENIKLDIVVIIYTFQKLKREGTQSTVKFRNLSPKGKKCTCNRKANNLHFSFTGQGKKKKIIRIHGVVIRKIHELDWKARLVNVWHYFLCLSIMHVQRVPNDTANERQNWRNTHPENVQWDELEWKVFSSYQGWR